MAKIWEQQESSIRTTALHRTATPLLSSYSLPDIRDLQPSLDSFVMRPNKNSRAIQQVDVKLKTEH